MIRSAAAWQMAFWQVIVTATWSHKAQGAVSGLGLIEIQLQSREFGRLASALHRVVCNSCQVELD